MDQIFPKLSDLASEFEKKRQNELRHLHLNVGVLESVLREVFEELQPSERDRLARVDILQRLAVLIGGIDICKGAVVLPFGSFKSNLYSPWGDLDISLIMPLDSTSGSRTPSKSRRLRVLKSVKESLLQAGGATRVQVLCEPRVPLLMFEDACWKISCDLSVSNSMAIIKSHVLGWITRIDPRCRQLIFLIKCWAKAQCINDPKLGTLNSHTIALLVIFHLQTRSPPILPPLNAVITEDILHETVDGDALKQCLLKAQALADEGFGRQNPSNIAELFLSFLTQFSAVEELWLQGLAVCTFSGKWGDRNTTDRAWDTKGYVMMVEDPFDLSDNCARSVHASSFQLICKAFSLSLEFLGNKSSYWFSTTLRETLFRWPSGYSRPLNAVSKSGSHHWQQPKPGIQQLSDYLSPIVFRVRKKDATVKKVAKRTNEGEVETLADGIASVSLEQKEKKPKKPRKPREEQRDRERQEPELDILLSIRKLFFVPRHRRRRRRRGAKPQRNHNEAVVDPDSDSVSTSP